jgi:hypothetical protein
LTVDATWEQVHAGDIVRGHDGNNWGVVSVTFGDPAGPVIVLHRLGTTVGPAQPGPGTRITIVERANTRDEAAAFAVLQAAGFGPEVLHEEITL